MCGITGFLKTNSNGVDPETTLANMVDSLQHRGPDNRGFFIDAEAGAALGHLRLAILDLSPLGHQPMESPSGRFVLIYNGEIYNYLTLREELLAQGYSFRGHSDTEVLLAAFESQGIRETVQACNGMFAMAVWDRQERKLTLVRDRMGIKPLYYGRAGSTFLFASELKALHHYPAFEAKIDRSALPLLLRHGYIPAPYSIYQGIRKLEPGTILTIGANQQERIERYWSAQEEVETSLATPFTGSESEALDELERLLRDSVRMRMLADVPLGAFLSGGIDSTTVVTLMQAQSERPVKSFTIGFQEAGFDEAGHARQIANLLGTDHTELYLTAQDALDVIPSLPHQYDEPFADSSQIPTFLVSKLARKDVIVSLSGDGGDELFGGYSRYALNHRRWQKVQRLPRSGRAALGGLLRRTPASLIGRGVELVAPTLGGSTELLQERVQRFSDVIDLERPEPLYHHLFSHWSRPTDLVPGVVEPLSAHTTPGAWARTSDFYQHMMFVDLVTYLPDDILVKVDRASMAVSLEARVPLLDHRVVQFAWQLPFDLKVRNGETKWALRRILDRYLPGDLFERPKQGFAVPLASWLRTELRDWSESLLNEDRLRREGYLAPAPIRRTWEEHLSGASDRSHLLWNVLMFQSWLDTYHS